MTHSGFEHQGAYPDDYQRPIPFDPSDAHPSWWPIGPSAPMDLRWHTAYLIQLIGALPWNPETAPIHRQAIYVHSFLLSEAMR